MADDAPTLTPEERAAISQAWHILIEDKGTLTNEERAGISDARHLLQQDMARGGAAQTDDDMTPEDRAAVSKAWRGLVEDQAHAGKLHYSPVPVRGMPLPGAYRVPKDAIAALGDGDMKLGGYVLHAMLGVEDDPERPDLIDPNVVRIVGNGSARDGRRILDRFFQQVRQGTQSHDDYLQPDGTRPVRIIRQ